MERWASCDATAAQVVANTDSSETRAIEAVRIRSSSNHHIRNMDASLATPVRRKK